MRKQTESRLKLAYDKYTMLQLMLFSIISKNGKWLKRKKGDIIFINDSEDVKIIEDSNGDLSAVQISNEYSCPITDPEIIDIINEIRPKKKKVTKKKAAEPKKKDYSGVTYMDVFKRVRGIMSAKTGYTPYDGNIEDEENGEVDIGLDFDGNEHIVWQNVRTFLGGWTEEDDEDFYETQSIFEVIEDLDMRYEKLASRWHAAFCDSCRILGTVNVEDNSPAGIMEALDKAGL